MIKNGEAIAYVVGEMRQTPGSGRACRRTKSLQSDPLLEPRHRTEDYRVQIFSREPPEHLEACITSVSATGVRLRVGARILCGQEIVVSLRHQMIEGRACTCVENESGGFDVWVQIRLLHDRPGAAVS